MFVIFNRFLVVFVDEKIAQASGCSIDKSVHFVKQLEDEFHINFFDRTLIAYKEGNEIQTKSFLPAGFQLEKKTKFGQLLEEVLVVCLFLISFLGSGGCEEDFYKEEEARAERW